MAPPRKRPPARNAPSSAQTRRNQEAFADEFDITKMLGDLGEKLTVQVRQPNLLGYKPHEIQQRFHLSKSRKRLYVGGNRAGKTTAGVTEGLMRATHRHPHLHIPDWVKVRGRIVSSDFDAQEQVIIPAIQRWVIPSDLIGGSWEESYRPSENILTFANGATIELKTYKQGVLTHAGTSRHWIHFDEPPPKPIFNENIARLLDTYTDYETSGGWWMTYTPIFGKDWIFREYFSPTEKGLRDDIDIFIASMDDNPHLNKLAIEDILSVYPEAERDIRRFGMYVDRGGVVFSEFDPELHTISREELSGLWGGMVYPPRDWKLYWSVDHVLNNPTAIYWHAVSPDDQVITFGERYVRNALVREHATAVREYERLMGREPDFRTGDPAMAQRTAITGTSILQEYGKYGIYIGTETVPRDPTIGIERMRKYMLIDPGTDKPFWRIYNCPKLVEELTNLRWETYVNEKVGDDKNPKETVHKLNDHGFDSCKYFFSAVQDLAPDRLERAKERVTGTNRAWSPNTRGFLRPVVPDSTVWSSRPISLDEFGLEFAND